MSASHAPTQTNVDSIIQEKKAIIMATQTTHLISKIKKHIEHYSDLPKRDKVLEYLDSTKMYDKIYALIKTYNMRNPRLLYLGIFGASRDPYRVTIVNCPKYLRHFEEYVVRLDYE